MNSTPQENKEKLERAVQIMEKMRERIVTLESESKESIAIIGTACRLPGKINDLDSFQHFLEEGKDAITEVPKSRWDLDDYYDPEPGTPGKICSRYGSFLDDIDLFDAKFFNISPREATGLDPQQRLLLEVVWQALENANCKPSTLRKEKAGVYIGLSLFDYAALRFKEADPKAIDPYFVTGSYLCTAAGRISYTLGLMGPSFTVDTACSSSLVSVHQAVQSLRNGECKIALAGGANLILTPEASINFSANGMLAPDGRCKTFDASANGYVRGEGCGIIVLKKLTDAQRDGDNILAIIRGSAINHDGPSAGLTVPSGPAQQAVIRSALENSQINPEDVDYIEAHGTGTSLGDPVELGAIGEVFKERGSKNPLFVGSVKTNLGHLEGAAGITGLLKIIASFQSQKIPRNLHFENPNPKINWESLPVKIPQTSTLWPDKDQPIAGVSSFGASGTNAHVILQASGQIESKNTSERNRLNLLCFSAKNETSLKQTAIVYREYLTPEKDFSTLCHAALHSRDHFPHRISMVARSVEDAHRILTNWINNPESTDLNTNFSEASPKLCLLLTGQGSQYVNMAKTLYDELPVFKHTLDQCAEALDLHLSKPLLDVVFSDNDSQLEINQTEFTQPALFAIEYSLTAIWKSWGVAPDCMIGHSVGEYAAACHAGVFSLQDAAKLIAYRGKLMQALPTGGQMAAIRAEKDIASGYLKGFEKTVSIAAINGPHNIVISGLGADVQKITENLKKEGISSTALEVSHAFHSPLMEPMLEAFSEIANSVQYQEPELKIISTVSGTVIGNEIASSKYWIEHISAPVRFADAILESAKQGFTEYLEVGPHPVLCGMARSFVPEGRTNWNFSLKKNQDDLTTLLSSASKLYAQGFSLKDAGYGLEKTYGSTQLPRYPFDRKSYWFDFKKSLTATSEHIEETSKNRVTSLAGEQYIFEADLDVDFPTWLKDHEFWGKPLFPAVAYIHELYSAAPTLNIDFPFSIQDLNLGQALTIDQVDKGIRQLIAKPIENENSYNCRYCSKREDEETWLTHSTAKLTKLSVEANSSDIKQFKARCNQNFDIQNYYKTLEDSGIHLKNSFQAMTEISHNESEAVVRLNTESIPQDVEIWPPLLDGGIQALGILGIQNSSFSDVLPFSADKISFVKRGMPYWACIKLTNISGKTFEGEIWYLDNDGNVLIKMEQFRYIQIDKKSIISKNSASTPLFVTNWTPAILESSHSVKRLILAGTSVEWELNFKRDQPHNIEVLAFDETIELTEEDTVLYKGSLKKLIDFTKNNLLHQPVAQFIVLTENAWYVEAEDAIDSWQSAIWGFTRSLRHEIPNTHIQLADIPSSKIKDDQLTTILNQVVTRGNDSEDEICWRNNQWFGLRINKFSEETKREISAFRIGFDKYGSFDDLAKKELQRKQPDDNEVEVAVRSCGLNFRDVLNALGMMEDVNKSLGIMHASDFKFGLECSGRICRVGSKVTRFKPGDAVIVSRGNGSLASHVTLNSDYVAKMPASISFNEAATIPVAYVTALYALEKLAKIKKGEKILIHAAAGGVGQAAVEIATRAGAEIYATASEGKWDYLKKLGIKKVYNSRNLEFADQILKDTNGAGVDIVLNSLNGDYITESFRTLSKEGRFVEIGKLDVWSNEKATEVRPDARYFLFDLNEIVSESPQIAKDLLKEVSERVEKEDFKPLRKEVFNVTKTSNAFRFMAQAKHIGKVVISIAEDEDPQEVVRKDSSYLITGGLGALGTLSAKWLAENGAEKIILTSRREPNETDNEAIKRCRKTGAEVEVFQVDLNDSKQLEGLILRLKDEALSLRGIIHAAGKLDDGFLKRLTTERFKSVLSSKSFAAEYLDQNMSDFQLDWFVHFSSIAASIGSAGQTNYSSANAFLDGLANKGIIEKKNIHSIAWGPWGEVGMAANLTDAQKDRTQKLGFNFIDPEKGLTALETILKKGIPFAIAAEIDWTQYTEKTNQRNRKLYSELIHESNKLEKTKGTVKHSFIAQLNEAPFEQRTKILQNVIKTSIARVLQLSDPQEITLKSPFFDLGIDSILTVELRKILEDKLETKLRATLLLDFPNLEQLLLHLKSGPLADIFTENEHTHATTPLMANYKTASKAEHPILTQQGPNITFPVESLPENENSIAVIGMACNFPGNSTSPEAYWELLSKGENGICEIPPDRWNADEFYDSNPDAQGKMYTKRAGFIERPDLFDADFFGITPKEAAVMDPQQRLILETAWKTLENAGIAADQIYGSETGVFLGVCALDHAMNALGTRNPEQINPYFGTGSSLGVCAGRTSYTLGLTGPSLAVDTACSSSLVAMNQACQNLRSGDCELAVAGGINVIISPNAMINFCKAHMLSSDGISKTFDEKADGYGRGEGCGLVLLKRLPDALRDGDPIQAVIRGIAVNQDGPSGGLTVPSGPAQERVIHKALKQGNVSPSEVGYVEAHGTGTNLGDPVEVTALGNVFRTSHTKENPILIGSAKANIGHLEGSAGIAGFIKAVLCLQTGQIPPQANFSEPNQKIAWDELPVKVPTDLTAWPENYERRICGLSSFGFSGTNAHVVLEAWPERKKSKKTPEREELLLLSARTKKALNELVEQTVLFLEEAKKKDDVTFAEICRISRVGRKAFEHRLAVIASNEADAISKLHTYPKSDSPDLYRGHVRRDHYNHTMIENDDRISYLRELAQAYISGDDLRQTDPENLGQTPRKYVSFPNYPFQKERFWFEKDNVQVITPERTDEQETTLPEANSLIAELRSLDPEIRLDKMIHHICFECATVMGSKDISRVEPDTGLFELGLDSLMAVELRNRLEQELHLSLPTTLVFDYPSASDVAKFLLDKIIVKEIETPQKTDDATNIEENADDLEAALREELADIEDLI